VRRIINCIAQNAALLSFPENVLIEFTGRGRYHNQKHTIKVGRLEGAAEPANLFGHRPAFDRRGSAWGYDTHCRTHFD
jgi:hypothetical protein